MRTPQNCPKLWPARYIKIARVLSVLSSYNTCSCVKSAPAQTPSSDTMAPPPGATVMLEEFLESKVVVDLISPFVCLGRLVRYDDHFLELKHADLHDLRDTETTRELYVAESVATGIKRNRK